MAVENVTFAGDGKQDVSGKMPSSMDRKSMSSGGPVQGPPSSNPGATASESIEQTAGMPPKAGNIQFAGDVGKS